MPTPPVLVVGVGAAGPGPSALANLRAADVVIGSPRQLELLPDDVTARRVPWGRPLRDSIRPILDGVAPGESVCVLASGDPLLHGVATTLLEVLGRDLVDVVPALSSETLARAFLRWPAETTTVLRDHRELPRHLVPGARVLVLSADRTVPEQVARQLRELGFGPSRLTVLEDLGTATEDVHHGTAADWSQAVGDLHVLAIDVEGDGPAFALVGGLPDEAFEHDGQLTKRDARASALARLAPRRGEHLWDVGAGAGSVGIEWARVHPRASVSSVERDPERAARVRRNAERLGTPRVRVVEGSAPDALADLPRPDAVFVGGGATRPGVLDACWDALGPGGRLVVHGVTLETESELVARHATLGGELVRLAIEHVDAIGSFRGWSPARTIVQWSLVKESR
ncbi:MAG: precorrin-6Y C5,15-methyltransferase (decarboxylating) subunit CbiT [Aeromicrobium erythreum]